MIKFLYVIFCLFFRNYFAGLSEVLCYIRSAASCLFVKSGVKLHWKFTSRSMRWKRVHYIRYFAIPRVVISGFDCMWTNNFIGHCYCTSFTQPQKARLFRKLTLMSTFHWPILKYSGGVGQVKAIVFSVVRFYFTWRGAQSTDALCKQNWSGEPLSFVVAIVTQVVPFNFDGTATERNFCPQNEFWNIWNLAWVSRSFHRRKEDVTIHASRNLKSNTNCNVENATRNNAQVAPKSSGTQSRKLSLQSSNPYNFAPGEFYVHHCIELHSTKFAFFGKVDAPSS